MASKQTHVNLLLSRNIPSNPLQLTSVNGLSVCRSPLERRWTILWSSSAVKPGMYGPSLGEEKRLDSKNAASLLLNRCVHMFWLAKEFICDNASIINSEFLKQLFSMSGVEQYNSVVYRP